MQVQMKDRKMSWNNVGVVLFNRVNVLPQGEQIFLQGRMKEEGW